MGQVHLGDLLPTVRNSHGGTFLNASGSNGTCAALTWEHEDEELQVKVIGGPSGGLVLRDRGNDGDVVLCVGRIQEGVETPRPRGDFP